MSSAGRVMMIAIDASESTLIERWIADGTLPNLARLRERGSYGRMAGTADWLVGTPWPSFYTASLPPEHGFLFHLQWRPELMRHERPGPEWLPLHPFYRDLGRHGKRVIAIDVPVTYEIRPGERFEGVEVTCWSTHDKIAPSTAWPPGTQRWINRQFGREPITLDIPSSLPVGSLLRLGKRLVRSVEQQLALTEALMAREPWDFLLLAIGAAHRGGHKLWNRSSIAGRATPGELEAFDRALRDIYVACDQAVGRLVRIAGPGVTVLVGSLHGMQENYSRFDLLPEMLDRVLRRGAPPRTPRKAPHGMLQALRGMVPIELRTGIKSRLPERIQDGLSMFWRPHDRTVWSRTEAFCLMGDLQGLIQINLKGRERAGIVEPGAAYDQLLDEITRGLMSFQDADTGVPVVKRMGRGNQLHPEARSRRVQPDLIVDWTETPARLHRAISSPQHGTIDWPFPGAPLAGNSGHHVGIGWLIAAGETVQPGGSLGNLHSHHLNATLHALLGVPRAGGMRGEPIPELLGTSSPAGVSGSGAVPGAAPA